MGWENKEPFWTLRISTWVPPTPTPCQFFEYTCALRWRESVGLEDGGRGPYPHSGCGSGCLARQVLTASSGTFCGRDEWAPQGLQLCNKPWLQERPVVAAWGIKVALGQMRSGLQPIRRLWAESTGSFPLPTRPSHPASQVIPPELLTDTQYWPLYCPVQLSQTL